MFQNNLLGAASLGGSEISCELLDTATIEGSAATHTISGADLGVAASNRQIVFVYTGGNACETGNLTSVTVGGVDLSMITREDGSPQAGYRSEIWAGIIATGTSADIVITQTCNSYWTSGTWYHMTGAASVAAYTATDDSMPMNASIDCDAGGVIIGAGQTNNGFPFAWTNITERSDLDNSCCGDGSSSMDTFAAAQSSLSITCTPTGTGNRAMCLAAWSPTDGFMIASGGTETTDGDYKVHSFTASGTFTVTRVGYVGTVEYLVIAGGGSGGFSNGGGGGAGGFRIDTAHTVTAQAYSITVGGGGAAASALNTYGSDGDTSTFDTISSSGGGTGGSGSAGSSANGKTGGSGGGGRAANTGGSGGAGNSGSFTPVEGYAGGSGTFTAPNYGAGGGGGSGGVGANGSGSAGGNGGIGTANSITGSSVTYASAGGGSAYNGGTVGTASAGGGTDGKSSSSSAADDATANTGGGGGGGGKDVADSAAGGAGGSGIVIIRYRFQ